MELIGQVILGAAIPSDALPADGRCLSYIEYPQLAKILHDDKGYYPYGKCKDGFNLPDLRSNIADSYYIIKVK